MIAMICVVVVFRKGSPSPPVREPDLAAVVHNARAFVAWRAGVDVAQVSEAEVRCERWPRDSQLFACWTRYGQAMACDEKGCVPK